MKKITTLIVAAITLLSVIVSGCKTGEFDPAVASNIARITGASTALVVLEIPKISSNPQVKSAIYTVTKAVEQITPETNQTFTAAAAPVVVVVVNDLVAKGKLNAAYSSLVKEGSLMVFSGIDLVFAKNPEAKATADNVTLVTKAFLGSFNAVFSASGVSVLSTERADEAIIKEIRALNAERIQRIK